MWIKSNWLGKHLACQVSQQQAFLQSPEFQTSRLFVFHLFHIGWISIYLFSCEFWSLASEKRSWKNKQNLQNSFYTCSRWFLKKKGMRKWWDGNSFAEWVETQQTLNSFNSSIKKIHHESFTSTCQVVRYFVSLFFHISQPYQLFLHFISAMLWYVAHIDIYPQHSCGLLTPTTWWKLLFLVNLSMARFILGWKLGYRKPTNCQNTCMSNTVLRSPSPSH